MTAIDFPPQGNIKVTLSPSLSVRTFLPFLSSALAPLSFCVPVDLFTRLCPADNDFITEIKAESLRRVQPVPPWVPVEHLLFNEEGLCYHKKDISLENNSVGWG